MATITIWLLLVVIFSTNATNNFANPNFQEGTRDKREAPYSGPSESAASEHTTFINQATLVYQELDYARPDYGVSCSAGDKKCPEANPCLPLVYCAAFYQEVIQNNTFCKLEPNAIGARCRSPREGREISIPAFPAPVQEGAEAPADAPSIEASPRALAHAFASLQTQDNIIDVLKENDLVVSNPETPEFGHLQFFQSTPEAAEIARIALLQNMATAAQQSPSLLPAPPIPGSEAPAPEIPDAEAPNLPVCPPKPICDSSDQVYRRLDGSCNNLNNPLWGKTFTPFERLSTIRYSDGISIPRLALSGKDLPSPRVVSSSIATDLDSPSQDFTLSVMQWGQFIDHDLTQTPISRIDDMTGILCCTPDGKFLLPKLTHPECLAIDIPDDDPFYSTFGKTCMSFVRSLPAPNAGCTLGSRNQMNQLSHLLDGSQVYGSSILTSNRIREFKDGLLKFQGDDLLPDDDSNTRFDFLAGDNRVNEQPHLAIIHTIWLRQHNLIAIDLLKLNPSWDDEKVYQETRKIVVAQLQHIVFNEWLPIVLGAETSELYNLLPRKNGFSKSYDQNRNPSILNEFAAAAFRFGHSLIQGTMRLFDKKHDVINSIELSDNFGKSQALTPKEMFDGLLRGLYKQPMQSFDNYVADDVTNKLFKTDTSPFGLDLVALNTQRGRDHGLATYNDLQSACHMPKFTKFDQLNNTLRPQAAALFANVYDSVEDIDVFIAGISEKPVSGGILGAIFNCIIREQFSRLKFGDRFFYENGDLPHSLSQEQLTEIRKTSWARIICDTSKDVQRIQPLAFRLPDKFNTKVHCSSKAIPKLDLRPWKDRQ